MILEGLQWLMWRDPPTPTPPTPGTARRLSAHSAFRGTGPQCAHSKGRWDAWQLSRTHARRTAEACASEQWPSAMFAGAKCAHVKEGRRGSGRQYCWRSQGARVQRCVMVLVLLVSLLWLHVFLPTLVNGPPPPPSPLLVYPPPPPAPDRENETAEVERGGVLTRAAAGNYPCCFSVIPF